jgi:outer membrane protein assembly factor BamD (BamD/ComL family)
MYRKAFLIYIIFVFVAGTFSGCGKKSEEELFNMAESAQKDGNPIEAIKAYRTLQSEYPDGENSAKALFMIGFVYAEELADTGKAIEAFEDFMHKYPNDDLFASADFMVKALRGEASDPVTAE